MQSSDLVPFATPDRKSRASSPSPSLQSQAGSSGASSFRSPAGREQVLEIFTVNPDAVAAHAKKKARGAPSAKVNEKRLASEIEKAEKQFELQRWNDDMKMVWSKMGKKPDAHPKAPHPHSQGGAAFGVTPQIPQKHEEGLPDPMLLQDSLSRANM